jgi:hypothetical protein
MSALDETYQWLDDDGPAFGGPGLEPRWTSSKKDAVSTAYAASSRIWFTASHGTLNEIYYPTIDRPQTRDMELLFTDEETFFHEEKRDFEYDFHYIDDDALAMRFLPRISMAAVPGTQPARSILPAAAASSPGRTTSRWLSALTAGSPAPVAAMSAPQTVFRTSPRT